MRAVPTPKWSMLEPSRRIIYIFSSFHSSAPLKGEVQTMAMTDLPTKLGYLINDADEHSTPRPKRVRGLHRPRQAGHGDPHRPPGDDGRRVQLFNGRPQRFDVARTSRCVGSNDILDELGVRERERQAGSTGDRRVGCANLVPGSLLNRLNPLQGRSTPRAARSSRSATARCRSSSTTRPTASR